MNRAAAAIALPLTFPPAAWAHVGGPIVGPDNWWAAWDWDLLILLNLGLLGWTYGLGLARLWRKGGTGRGVGRGQAACFLMALVVLFAALISPLDALGEELSSAHMVQHLLLMEVAPPLFVLGAPMLVLTWGLPREWRPAAGRLWRRPSSLGLLWHPLVLWVAFAATLWAWHLPALYHAALRDPLVHDAEHLSFFAVSCLFWRVVLDPLGRRRLRPLAAVPFLFTTSLHATLLGVFLTLSPRVWYTDYVGRTSPWGLAPLEDQQLAGLIMWVPACSVYPVVAAILLGRWLAGGSSPSPSWGPSGRTLSAEGGTS